MGTFLWCLFTTAIGAIIGHFMGSAVIGGIIGLVVGFCATLGIFLDISDFDFPDFHD